MKIRTHESISEWLESQLLKPKEECKWCGSMNWYKKKGVTWYCGSCDPEGKLLTWPQRLELIRRLRAKRDNLEELNDLPDNTDLGSTEWSNIEHISTHSPLQNVPDQQDVPDGVRLGDYPYTTDGNIYGYDMEESNGIGQSHSVDERWNEGKERCVQENPSTDFHGVMSKKEKLQRLKLRLQSFTTVERPVS